MACPSSGPTLSRTSRNAVLRGPGLSGEAELAVVIGCCTSPGEVLDAIRTGAEDSIFEYPDTVPVAVGASKNWRLRVNDAA